YVSTKANVSKAGGFAQIVTTEGSSRQHGRGIGQAIAIADLRAGRPGHDTGASQATEVAQNGGPEAPRGERPSGGAERGEEMPGDAPHQFLPGLRSAVANDAQGDQGDGRPKGTGRSDHGHRSRRGTRRWVMAGDLAGCHGGEG